jgi:hypothetical protein
MGQELGVISRRSKSVATSPGSTVLLLDSATKQ